MEQHKKLSSNEIIHVRSSRITGLLRHTKIMIDSCQNISQIEC